MIVWLTVWWAWAAVAIAAVIFEVIFPAFLFLGFTIGGAIMALLIGLGMISPTPAWAVLMFALLSLAGYIGLRLALGNPREQVKIITRDINDN